MPPCLPICNNTTLLLYNNPFFSSTVYNKHKLLGHCGFSPECPDHSTPRFLCVCKFVCLFHHSFYSSQVHSYSQAWCGIWVWSFEIHISNKVLKCSKTRSLQMAHFTTLSMKRNTEKQTSALTILKGMHTGRTASQGHWTPLHNSLYKNLTSEATWKASIHMT